MQKTLFPFTPTLSVRCFWCSPSRSRQAERPSRPPPVCCCCLPSGLAASD